MEHVKKLEKQFDRIDEKMNKIEPGTTDYGNLQEQQGKIFDKLLANDKAVADREFKDSELTNKTRELDLKEKELMLKELEMNKPLYKRVEFILQLMGLGLSVYELRSILKYEESGSIVSKAFNLLHRIRLFSR